MMNSDLITTKAYTIGESIILGHMDTTRVRMEQDIADLQPRPMALVIPFTQELLVAPKPVLDLSLFTPRLRSIETQKI